MRSTQQRECGKETLETGNKELRREEKKEETAVSEETLNQSGVTSLINVMVSPFTKLSLLDVPGDVSTSNLGKFANICVWDKRFTSSKASNGNVDHKGLRGVTQVGGRHCSSVRNATQQEGRVPVLEKWANVDT